MPEMQAPRFQFAPPSMTNSADEVIDLMAQIGMPLDEWQQQCMILMLGERPDNMWSAFEFGLLVARQNGKGGVLEARELGGLFLFGDRKIIHSAHESDTAAEAYQRMDDLISGTPWLAKRVRKSIGSPGKQYVLLKTGQKLSYRTRTAGGGRGFSAPTVILDEAQELTAQQIAALMPVVSAQPNPQLIYTGTVKESGYVFRGVVERGRKKIGERLAYAEWSSDPAASSDDEQAMLDANPSAPHRISLEYIRAEHDAFVSAGAEAEFRMERMSIWPETMNLGSLIGVSEWEVAKNEKIVLPPTDAPLSVGVAISPDRQWASVGFAWQVDGFTRLDLAKHAAGTAWILPWLVEIQTRRNITTVAVDQGGPAGTMLPAMGLSKLPVRVADTAGYKVACASFVDAVRHGKIRHRGQPELTVAANGVKEHKVGDGFVYARRDSGVVISPLEAVTLAAWGLTPDPKQKEFFVLNLNELAD